MADHDCQSLTLFEAEKAAKKNGLFVIPKKEAAVMVSGGKLVEVLDVVKK